jgi:putative isomerase
MRTVHRSAPLVGLILTFATFGPGLKPGAHRALEPLNPGASVIAGMKAGARPEIASQDQSAADPSVRFRELIDEMGAKREILRPPSGLLKYDYVVPSGPYYQLFDWDAYFMGVALAYDKQARYLASSVRNFLEYAGPPTSGSNGYTPRIIAPEGFWSLPEMTKPFLAQMSLLASQSMRNYWWLRGDNYARLEKTLFFWENVRRTPDGLFVWFNGDESGVDNNPAVSWEPAEVSESVDLVCYLVREYRAMALIARALEKKEDEAKYWKKAEALAGLLNEKMWSEADAMYFNIDRRTGEMVKIKTWTNFVPLWADLAPADRAKATIARHLLNPTEFWGARGLRTLAATEPLYNPKSGYWRGPTWVISSYMMTHGLVKHGYQGRALEEATRVTRLLVDDIEASGGMNENYNPDTGAPAANTNFLSWNLLAEHWIDEIRAKRDPIAIPAK